MAALIEARFRAQTMTCKGVLLLLLWCASSAHAGATFPGLVTYVTDGDTLWVQPDAGGTAVKVRLQGLDAPEICQPGGKAARELLTRLALNKRVTVQVVSHDQYGRTLAAIAVEGGDVGAQLVRAGQAWSYGWRGRPGAYAAEEALARQSRQGVFAAQEPESPRDFRKRHGSCHTDRP